jgi:hypothetical protein
MQWVGGFTIKSVEEGQTPYMVLQDKKDIVVMQDQDSMRQDMEQAGEELRRTIQLFDQEEMGLLGLL